MFSLLICRSCTPLIKQNFPVFLQHCASRSNQHISNGRNLLLKPPYFTIGGSHFRSGKLYARISIMQQKSFFQRTELKEFHRTRSIFQFLKMIKFESINEHNPALKLLYKTPPFKNDLSQKSSGLGNSCDLHISTLKIGPHISLTSQNLNEWKQDCSRQSVFNIFTVFFRLIFMILRGLCRVLCAIGKVLFFGKIQKEVMNKVSAKAKEKAKEVGKTAATKVGKSVMTGAKKSGIFMARELPKVAQKLQKDVPVLTRNLYSFAKYVDHELRQVKTGPEKLSLFYQILINTAKRNRTVQQFLLLLFVYGAFCATRMFRSS